MTDKKNDVDYPDLEKNGVFYLYEEITESSSGEVVEFILRHSLRKPRLESLTLIITSPGGLLDQGFGIIDAMEGSPIPIRTVGIGMVGSAALAIFMAGAKGHRMMTPNCEILSHQYSSGSYGKEHDLISSRKRHDLTTERLIRHYKRHTGQTDKVIKEKLLPASDVWLTAAEAKKFGICDVIKLDWSKGGK